VPRPDLPPVDLSGLTVGVTADRRGEDQAILLRRHGLSVLHAPMLRTERQPVDDDLQAATRLVIQTRPDFLIANTGFGIRSWWERAAGWGLDTALTEVVGDARIAARGPKAAGALRMLGLPVWWRSPSEDLASVAEHLIATGVDGRRIALQLHGDDRQTITARLQGAGATVDEVPVYRWSMPIDEGPALDLIRACCEGRIAAVTFTAGPAVRHLLELADFAGLAGPLLDALNGRTLAVCVGPVCAAVAREEGITAPLVPEHWRLGSMVNLVAEALAAVSSLSQPTVSPDSVSRGA
jgi:uroporphyrinogen-III synthase